MLEKHGIACDLMNGFNWDKWTTGKTPEQIEAAKRTCVHSLMSEPNSIGCCERSAPLPGGCRTAGSR
jgi:hypothetical protein